MYDNKDSTVLSKKTKHSHVYPLINIMMNKCCTLRELLKTQQEFCSWRLNA